MPKMYFYMQEHSIQAVKKLLERPVAYHGILAKAFNSVPAAVMLSQGIYWQGIAEEKGEAWFWVTAAKWYDQTGISEKAQKRARTLLIKAGVWDEELRGMPRRLYFKVDVSALVDVIRLHLIGRNARTVIRGSRGRFPSTGETPGQAQAKRPDTIETKLETKKTESVQRVGPHTRTHEGELVSVDAKQQKEPPPQFRAPPPLV